MAQHEKKTAGAFDIRNIIGALLDDLRRDPHADGPVRRPRDREDRRHQRQPRGPASPCSSSASGSSPGPACGRSWCPSTSSRWPTTRPARHPKEASRQAAAQSPDRDGRHLGSGPWVR